MINKLFRASLVFSALTLSMVVHADDIKEAMNTAAKHYEAGELSQAIAQLDYASTLIRQQKGEQVKQVFPPAPAGWEAQDAESEVAGAAMFGGGITATRSYYNGEQNIEIQLMMDSPMLQAFSMMLSNPSMIAMSGGKLTKIQGLQAVQKADGNSLEIQFVTKTGAMITISGDTASQKTMLELANAIDLSKL